MISRATVYHAPTGTRLGYGEGICSSRERNRAYRKQERTCPTCQQPAVIKGKEEFGGGWLCLAPETPILYSDFVWRPVGDAKPGDAVIGFDEYPTHRRFGRKLRITTIEDVWASRQQTQRLMTANAEITTTAAHRWLSHHTVPGHIGRWGDPWVRTDRLRIGNSLRNIGTHEPPPASEDYRAGYLAGMTLGDGTMRSTPGQASRPKAYWRVALRASDEPVLGRIVSYLASFGIEAYVRPFDSGVKYDGIAYLMKKVELWALDRLERLHNVMTRAETMEFQRGFIAGFFDAEGSGEDGRLSLYQKDARVLRRVARYARNHGFEFRVRERNDSRSIARLIGGQQETIRFLGTCQPALMRKASVFGTTMQYDTTQILTVEKGPVQDVIDIQTSSGTFLAAGIATHNCWRKKGGCNAKFPAGDQRIEGQDVGEIENPDLPDTWNAVDKMGKKRAYVDAVLSVTGASAIFTQDMGADPTEPAGASGLEHGPVVSGELKQAATQAAITLSGGDLDQAKALWERVQADLDGYMPEAAARALLIAAQAAVQPANETGSGQPTPAPPADAATPAAQQTQAPAPAAAKVNEPANANPHGARLRALASTRGVEDADLANLIRNAVGQGPIPTDRARAALPTMLARVSEEITEHAAGLIDMFYPPAEPQPAPTAGEVTSVDFAAVDPPRSA